LDNTSFLGDPGSIYLVYCANGCKDDETRVFGVGVYYEGSSICKSAIHAGVL